MKRRIIIVAGVFFVVLAAFLGWRMIWPPKYFAIADWFAMPISTVGPSQPQFDLSAESCAACHADSYHEWSSTMHARVWTDSYFQADWRSEGGSPICRNCHTPLDRQQEERITGFRGNDPWSPVFAPNPAFDPSLQKQGVTCAACHVRNGVVYGPQAGLAAPHPTAAWANPNEACIRCHVVTDRPWDSFLRLPPCGLVAEIERARPSDFKAAQPAALPSDGYLETSPAVNPAALGCVECHMSVVDRPLTPGGPVRRSRRHLWLGGHDPATVRAALTIAFASEPEPAGGMRYTLTIANTGAAHDVPTGALDRHLTVDLQVIDAAGRSLQSQTFTLERKVLGRPFLVDLWDSRLRPNAPRSYSLTVPADSRGAAVEAVVRYWLMSASHRDRLKYDQPISQEIYREHIPIADPVAHPN